ncbi:MAG TPA: sulfur carrier protein ThiS [Pseudomonas sp.]|jgi:sulfur carrier protein|uniref:Sulfur carrier protein ThiS n=1 Tax=Halopseudomonas pachastrellae TaxID=254161 RepID=A0A1S8DJU0_9GAMM|nr:sulfur carrier protein ThiS [Halopseudomonas pachastrellae]MAB41629.1 sulfur carrier protein ThiS [Pseudomonadales bacterium]MAP29420.1 sulfur carrier protein ThiS [Pseudomonas sp.]MBO09123.1 sulfur carrier protein ThiS [Acidobacteriota bacterium]MED5492119.1 sulfur carrier protein ThiS [Pseudomonadota bacterium]MAQ52826.1 sulfur carrier protein ThiS [Pseudomonas sp.]|tara:strand:- start:5726 stop:5926 length:201 start_codon:yes stop_codon:yes gene_type:complete
MQILLNGEPHQLDQPLTLSALIDQLGLTGKRLAVELNLEIVPRSQHADTRLSEGDRVEIVHAIGGG